MYLPFVKAKSERTILTIKSTEIKKSNSASGKRETTRKILTQPNQDREGNREDQEKTPHLRFQPQRNPSQTKDDHNKTGKHKTGETPY